MNTKERFPDWRKVYETQAVEEMPWFNPTLDADLAAEINTRKLLSGSFLDIGTGPGTQAVRLSEMGFTVTATDISPAAIKKAQKLSSRVTFIQDDIINTAISDKFDYAFDRGCFHCIDPDLRLEYVQSVRTLVKHGGLLFLKTFSTEQTEWDYGPYRFSTGDIRKVFAKAFNVELARETVYQGTLNPLPKALFLVLR